MSKMGLLVRKTRRKAEVFAPYKFLFTSSALRFSRSLCLGPRFGRGRVEETVLGLIRWADHFQVHGTKLDTSLYHVWKVLLIKGGPWRLKHSLFHNPGSQTGEIGSRELYHMESESLIGPLRYRIVVQSETGYWFWVVILRCFYWEQFCF